MHLTPRETDRLILFTAAELARRRLARGLKLNYPEARAVIADAILEGARDGRSASELMTLGTEVLTVDQVMTGVPTLLGNLQIEAVFPDGQKLVTVHEPIAVGIEGSRPGEVVTVDGEIELNEGRETAEIRVVNRGDRPVQVGSHFHFFEVNRALDFDRGSAYGMRLDIPAGTAVRFEPGDEQMISLTAIGGDREVHGLNQLTEGATIGAEHRDEVLSRSRDRGFGSGTAPGLGS